jgi:hypothetical protein
MTNRYAAELASAPRSLRWAKEVDIYTVKDDVDPVPRYIFQKELKLGRRDQDYLINPSKANLCLRALARSKVAGER